MKKRVNRLSMVCGLILIVGLALFASGCAEVATLSDWVSEVPRGHGWVSNSATGEGSISSADGSVEATFSFQLKYVQADEGFTGVLEFAGRRPGQENKRVDVRGVIDDATVTLEECHVVLRGEYQPQPAGLSQRGGGEFVVTVSCGEYFGLYGLLDPTFDISLYGGEFAGYTCGGTIGEGSIDLYSGNRQTW